jgi:hypothetical protein
LHAKKALSGLFSVSFSTVVSSDFLYPQHQFQPLFADAVRRVEQIMLLRVVFPVYPVLQIKFKRITGRFGKRNHPIAQAGFGTDIHLLENCCHRPVADTPPFRRHT